MSTLPILVTALTTVDGRDRPTIEYYARTIRKAGYITTGKRGMGAAKVTCHEAINLLIALNGCDTAQEAPVAIDRFRSLQQFREGTARQIREWTDSYAEQPQPIRDVMDTNTFGEALDALLEGTPDLVVSFIKYYNDAYPNFPMSGFLDSVKLRFFGIDITFGRYLGNIELFHMNGSSRIVDFSTSYMMDMNRAQQGFYKRPDADRKVSVTIGLPTLIAAWEGLHPVPADTGTAIGEA